MNDDHTVSMPLIKLLTVWGAALGLKSWGDLASLFAALYTLLLISEWFWKKFWRPMLVRHGVITEEKPRK